MRVFIVDDEAPARARLARLLAAHGDVELIGHAGDGAEALERIAALQPQLLLLDVQMPGVSGLDLAASLPDPAPAIVFVTAHDRYALAAFDAQPLDYLLKPIDAPRLARALDRARQRLGAARAATLPPRQLLIPDHQGLRVVLLDEITWLEAADNYVAVHAIAAAATPPLLRRTLAALLADLGPGFVRCHRSAAVALAHVARVQGLDGGDAIAHLRNGAQVRVSRALRRELVDRLAVSGVAPE